MTDNLSVAQEALFKTLAVMTNADTNVQTVEVEIVQSIFKYETGIEVSEKDVRMAARSEFLEDRSISKYLSGVESKLSDDDKKTILKSLGEVIKADDDTRPREAAMFNDIIDALKISPSDVAGL